MSRIRDIVTKILELNEKKTALEQEEIRLYAQLDEIDYDAKEQPRISAFPQGYKRPE